MSTVPPTSVKPVTRPNLRRSRRQPPKQSTKLRAYRNAFGLGPNIAVSILDVSETGVRLVTKEPLAKRAEFELILEAPGMRPIKLIAQVIWSLALADGNLCVGAEFAKRITYAELTALSHT
jgi:hypothetical protein